MIAMDMSISNEKPLFGLFILPTTRCDLSCSYCFTRYHPENASPETDLRNIEPVCDLLAELTKRYQVISFVSGGEPLLYQEYPKLIDLLSVYSVGVHLITNWNKLYNIQPKFWPSTNGLRLYVSCHERWTRVRQFLEASREQYQHPIIVSQIVTPQNLAECEALSDFCRKYNFQFLPQLLGSVYDSEMEKQSYLGFNHHNLVRLKQLFKLNGRARFLVRWNHWQATSKLIRGCPSLNRTFIIYPSGRVYPCFFRQNSSLGILGTDPPENLLKKNFEFKINIEEPSCARLECNCLLEMPDCKRDYLTMMNNGQG